MTTEADLATATAKLEAAQTGLWALGVMAGQIVMAG